MSITRLLVQRSTLVVVLFAVLAVFGIYGYTQMRYELLPKFSAPVITITTAYPGASPNEVENSVTKLIEEAVSGLDKVDAITATSTEGASFIAVEFKQNTDVNIALQDAQRKVDAIIPQLPADAKKPVLSKIALDEIPVLRMGLTSKMPETEFYTFVTEKLQPRLARIPGVAQIVLIGGEQREIKINLNAEKLKAYGLSILQVANAVKNANLDFPTGRVKDTDGQFVVRLAGKFSSLDEIRNLVVGRSKQGGEIRLSDIAEVEDGRKEPTNINRINGKSSIGMLVNKQADANAVEVSKLVRSEVEKIEKEYADKGVKFDIAQDGSTFTLDAAHAVQEDLALAVLLVALVMLVFLHSLRNSFIVMIAIPCSLISTVGVMHFLDYTFNLMSLLALSLAVGIWVDDSIVVLENIYRRLELGDDKVTAAVRGRDEIGFTALAITLVDVVVFVPLALTGGIIGNIMRQFSIVMAVSTLFSLLVSFTVTPVLASRISKLEHLTKDTLMGRFGLWFEGLFKRFTNRYIEILKWSLQNRWKVFGSAFLMLIASCSLFPLGFIGGEFIAQADRGEFSVALELAPGTKLEETNALSQKIEQMLMEIPEVEKVSANVGASSDGFVTASSSNLVDISVKLLPKEEREKQGMRSTTDVKLYVKQMTQNIPGAKVRVNDISIFGTANQTPIQLVVSGPDLDSVKKGAIHLKEILKATKGATDVRLSAEDGNPETRIEIDRDKLAFFGLSMAEVGAVLRIALAGDNDAKYREGDTEYDIRIQLDEFDRSSTENIENLAFVNQRGQVVELKQFATVYQTTGPTKLQRRDRNYAIVVYAQLAGRSLTSVWQDAQKKLAENPMPAGVSIAPLGDLKNQQEGFGSLALALVAGLIFVYLIMVALYNSYKYPLVVLFSIPLAVIGALLAIALAGKNMSIFTMLGMIMLLGLVSKNAILLVDFANRAKAEGLNTIEALVEAGRERLRPILMTTLTMIFGMMPIALSGAAGAEWKTGLAWALIGGLTSSMFLTLVIVPIVYYWFDNIGNAFAKVKVFAGKPVEERVLEPVPEAVNFQATK